MNFAHQTVARVGETITAEMTTQARIAETLAQAASLPSADPSATYGEVRRLQAAHPLWCTVELHGLNGHQLLNLLSPLGTAADRSADDEVVNRRRPVIGGIGPAGSLSDKNLLALHVSVTRDDTLVDILTVALAPDSVDTILRGTDIPAGWFGMVVDSSGHIITRSVDGAAGMGQPASPTLQRAIVSSPDGFYPGVTREGVAVTTAFETLPDAGHWSVHLGIPRDVLDGPVWRALYVVAFVAALELALAVALVALLARDLRRRREEGQAAATLEASEEREILAVSAADLGTWRWDVGRDRIYGSERCRTLLGLPQSAQSGLNWTTAAFLGVVHPDDRPALDAAVQRCFTDHLAFELNFRVVATDVASQWRHARGRAVAEPNGREIHGILADIDAEKRSQQERSDLLRRLASAQEEVERRIAHDLHDQVGQTVTGLSLGLKGLEQAIMYSSFSQEEGDQHKARLDLQERVHWLQSLTGDIGRELHRVASDLRPTALDDLGLPRALAALVADWAGRYGIAVDVQVVGSEDRLPDEIASVVYRVVQEALTNVLKHARARTVSIVMDRRPKDVRVVIEDDGVGIDQAVLEEAATGVRRRLGLSGMRERLSLIGGTLRIETSVDTGTTLFVAIPLDLEPSTKDAA